MKDLKKKELRGIFEEMYTRMRRRFGHQHWWPGDGAFEIMVGAILTQNTSWRNVEKAIANLKRAGALDGPKMLRIKNKRLARLIKSAGYYNVKAKRLREFLKFLQKECGFSLEKLRRRDFTELRRALLGVKGIGEETADSMLLYALGKPTFVIDAYTKRVLSRHGMISKKAAYGEIKGLFEENLRPRLEYFRDYHAQIVAVGKGLCRPKVALCEKCPLSGWMGPQPAARIV